MTSLADLLFGPGGAPQEALRSRLPGVLALPAAGGVPADEVHDQTVAAVADLLDMPVGNLALAAWERYRRVSDACEETGRRPGSRQVVRLAGHTISSEQHPTIELDVAGRRVPLLTLTLLVEIEVEAASLVVERGRIVHVHPGAASASATLSAGGVRLAQGSLGRVDLATGSPSWA